MNLEGIERIFPRSEYSRVIKIPDKYIQTAYKLPFERNVIEMCIQRIQQDIVDSFIANKLPEPIITFMQKFVEQDILYGMVALPNQSEKKIVQLLYPQNENSNKKEKISDYSMLEIIPIHLLDIYVANRRKDNRMVYTGIRKAFDYPVDPIEKRTVMLIVFNSPDIETGLLGCRIFKGLKDHWYDLKLKTHFLQASQTSSNQAILVPTPPTEFFNFTKNLIDHKLPGNPNIPIQDMYDSNRRHQQPLNQGYGLDANAEILNDYNERINQIKNNAADDYEQARESLGNTILKTTQGFTKIKSQLSAATAPTIKLMDPSDSLSEVVYRNIIPIITQDPGGIKVVPSIPTNPSILEITDKVNRLFCWLCRVPDEQIFAHSRSNESFGSNIRSIYSQTLQDYVRKATNIVKNVMNIDISDYLTTISSKITDSGSLINLFTINAMTLGELRLLMSLPLLENSELNSKTKMDLDLKKEQEIAKIHAQYDEQTSKKIKTTEPVTNLNVNETKRRQISQNINS